MDKEQMIQNYKDARAARDSARDVLRLLERDANIALDALAVFAPFQVGDLVEWKDGYRSRFQGKRVEREVVGEIVSVAPHVDGDDGLVFSFRARPYKKDGTPSLLNAVSVQTPVLSTGLYGVKAATLKERGAGLLLKAKKEATNA